MIRIVAYVGLRKRSDLVTGGAIFKVPFGRMRKSGVIDARPVCGGGARPPRRGPRKRRCLVTGGAIFKVPFGRMRKSGVIDARPVCGGGRTPSRLCARRGS